MSLLLSGSDGLSDVDGTAATPAIRGTDANTGIFFPAADTIAFSEGGVEAMRIDSAGNVGIGTSSPGVALQLSGQSGRTSGLSNPLAYFAAAAIDAADAGIVLGSITGNTPYIAASKLGNGNATNLAFFTNDIERVRIDSSGNLLVGQTSGADGKINATNGSGGTIVTLNSSGTAPAYAIQFKNTNGTIGNITVSGTTTAYNTSSDYRLKENVAPMQNALATVAALKPCTYTWKADGSAGQGFIAHELQAVVPDCVTGAKDAVETIDDLDAEGRKIGTKEVPRYQGVDTSFLVATIVAALQEQQAIISAMETRLAALEE